MRSTRLRPQGWPRAALLGLLLACGAIAQAADCVKASESCVEGPATRNIGGYPVYRDCWRYTDQYSCVSANTTDDCQPLRDQGCSQVGSTCVDTNTQGACMVYEQTWQCRVGGGATSMVTNCGSQQFCLDGHCFDTSHAPDPDFARALTGLEVQREAGKYIDPNSLVVFQGYDNRCRKKLFGLVNCCKGGGTSGSLFTDFSLISGAGSQAAGACFSCCWLTHWQPTNTVLPEMEPPFQCGAAAHAHTHAHPRTHAPNTSHHMCNVCIEATTK